MKGLIFTYLLCYGGAFAALFRPWYGLLIYVCFAIIKPESLWYWSVPAGNYSRIIAISLLLGWVLNGMGSWKLGRAKATLFALVGYWAWALLSTLIVASNLQVGLGFVEELAKVLLPFVAGLTLVDSEKKLKQLAWVILISQGYVALEMNQAYYSGFNRLHQVGFGGMDNNCVCIAMVTATGMAIFMGMYSSGWKRGLCLVLGLLMAHCTMFGFSRGGMLGLIIVGGVSFILIDKRPKHFAMFAVAVFVALMLAGPSVRERFMMTFADESERDGSAQSRLDMWGQCLILMQENPVLGVGPNHWGYQARDRFGWGGLKEAHTLWLQIGAELGVVGLGLLLGFYLVTMANLWPIARRKIPDATEWDVAVARMIIASFVGFMFSAQFVSLEGLELPFYICLIGAGTLKLQYQRKRRVANQQPGFAYQQMPAYRLHTSTATF